MFKAEIKSERYEDICILIKVENHSYNYLCECGEAKKLGVKECQDTKAIFISHTHIDHFVNFDTVLRHQLGTQRQVVIVGPTGIIEQVQNRIKSYCWNLIEEGAISYEVREILDDTRYRSVELNPPLWEQENEREVSSDCVFREATFKVEYQVLDHKTSSVSYLFKADDKTKILLRPELKGGKWVAQLKQAYQDSDAEMKIEVGGQTYKAKELFDMITVEKGKSLGVIMDHAANASNHSLIKKRFMDCDEVYIECFYKDEDKEFAIKNYHSYASQSGRIMKECKVRKAIPVHFSRKYSAEDIEQIISQFEMARG